MNALNAREQLEAAQTWLGFQHEDLSFGLKSAEDALKLWRAWTSDPELPEFCDAPETAREKRETLSRIRSILGYDPWKRCAELAAFEA